MLYLIGDILEGLGLLALSMMLLCAVVVVLWVWYAMGEEDRLYKRLYTSLVRHAEREARKLRT
jgi:ABC-type siderophore export system fused ATPase/permease subunit